MAAYVKANNTTNLNIASSWTANSGFPSSTADTATWNSTVTGANTVSLGGAITAGTLTIANPGGLVTLNAATTTTLTIGSGGIDLSSATQNLDINGPIQIALAANQPWNVASGRRLATGTTISGSFVITKNGAGLLQLNNSGTFSGLTLNAGSVWVVVSGAALTTPIGARTSSTTVSIANGGKLEFQANDVIATAANLTATDIPTITLNGSADNGTYLYANRYNGLGNITLNSAWLLQASYDVGSYRGWQFIGTVTSTGTSRISSNSSTPNHLNGLAPTTFNVTSGTLTIEASASLIDGSGAQSGAGALTKSGAGTLTVAAANTFTGAVSVSAGTLNANSLTALGADVSSGTVSSGATLSLGAALNYSTRNWSITGTGVGTTKGALEVNYAGSVKIGSISLAGPTLIRGTASGGNLTSNISGTQNLTLGVNSSTSLFLSGVIGIGTGSLTISETATSTGTVYLTGNNTFTGPIIINRGTLEAKTLTALGASSSTNDITVSSGATLTLGSLSGIDCPSRNLNITGLGAITSSGALLLDSGSAPSFSKITLGAATTRLHSNVNASLNCPIETNGQNFGIGVSQFQTLTLSSTAIIALSLSGGLLINEVTAKTGTVSIFSQNKHASTIIYQGTVSIGVSSVFASGSITSGPLGRGTFTISGSATVDASSSVTLHNNVVTNAWPLVFGGSAELTLAGSVSLAGDQTITTNGTGGSLVVSGVIGNPAYVDKITKNGTNTLRLTAANVYTGGTDISAGMVQAGNTQALGTTGTVTLTASGATLQTLTAGGQNGKLTVAGLTNSAGGTIKIGG